MSGLSVKVISKIAQNGAVFARGMLYFQKKRVRQLNSENRGKSYMASVVGSEVYAVSISLDADDKPDGFSCDCPAYKGYANGACKHIVATLFAIMDDKNSVTDCKEMVLPESAPLVARKTDSNTRMFLRYFSDLAQSAGSFQEQTDSDTVLAEVRKHTLVPKLNIVAGRWVNPVMYAEFSYGCERQYSLRDVRRFAEALHDGRDEEINFGKYGDFHPQHTVFDDASRKLAQWLEKYYIEETGRSRALQVYGHTGAIANERVRLTPFWLNEFFINLLGQQLEVVIAGNSLFVEVVEVLPKLQLTVENIQGGICLRLLDEQDMLRLLDSHYGYVLAGNTIAAVNHAEVGIFETFINSVYARNNRRLEIADNDAAVFLSDALPALEKVADVYIAQEILDKYCRWPLVAKALLAINGSFIECALQFCYCGQEFNPLVNQDVLNIDGRILLRDKLAEAQVVKVLSKFGFHENHSLYLLGNEDKMLEFLDHGISELNKYAEVYGDESLASLRPRPPKNIRTSVSISEGNLLELAVEYENAEIAELIALLNALRQKKKYYRLKTGEFVSLESEELREFAGFLASLNIKSGSLTTGKTTLAKRQAWYLDALANEHSGLRLNRGSNFEKLIREISSPQHLEHHIPKGINGVLRKYQGVGFKWLKTLSEYGFGGILADDMGLGKTLQALTLIQSEAGQGKTGPTLIVAPTSLIYNWQNEVAKFTPELRAMVVAGTKAKRRELLRNISNYDIVITTYGLLRSDIQDYEEVVFGKCFIDEAQHIKNPATLSARAVKRIQAQGYFALTGTPVENSLTELWSIFDFIMPGYLGQHGDFVERYELPIVKEQNQTALVDLKRKIQPFVMRRLKKQVLKELPDKIESLSVNEMSKEQRKIYKAFMLHARGEFENEIKKNGFAKSQIAILTLLMRLRQICCHPALFMENYQGGSGKLEQLSELLEDALDGSHRVLLFSQFTSMLGIIKQHLLEQGREFFYLDGSTPAQERIELVNRFNCGERGIFLISLKAGGTGLNLTGADVVIHYDPWWNPAVEDQATDRAHRIGQKNAVQVYRMITKNSIEEKIFELQQKKRQLIDAIIEPGETMLNKLTEAEIRALFE